MPNYMLIIKDEDVVEAYFYDSLAEAVSVRLNAVCGMGLYVEVYERMTNDDGVDEYVFWYC